MDNIVILTGAGISAESGMGTFRGAGGLWNDKRIEDVATPEGFARDPDMVHEFYNMRRQRAAQAKPNAAHHAIARLQREYHGQVTLVTQNVDALHEAGGSEDVIHMHGRLAGALCGACDHRWDAPPQMHTGHPCPACQAPMARPDVVWFGEMPYFMDRIYQALEDVTIFVAIGTSGQVYPAAGFVQEALRIGAHTVEINLDPSATVSDFAETRFGPATQTVPAWVDEILNE